MPYVCRREPSCGQWQNIILIMNINSEIVQVGARDGYRPRLVSF